MKTYILLFFLLTSLVCNAQKPWDGKEIKKWDKGLGTELKPYLIEEPAHLAYLSKMVREGESYEGRYFKLVNPLDMGQQAFKPIGFYDKYTKVTDDNSDPTEVDDSKYFKGVFDGNHKEIDNLLINYKTEQTSHGGGVNSLGGIGLFSCINKPTVIKNVTIGKRSNIIPDDVAVGAIIGIMMGGLVENCINRGLVYAGKNESGNETGGLIGIVIDGLVQYCVNDAQVVGNMTVGGMIGQLSGKSKVNACVNYGSIMANYTNAGGIVGSIWDNASITNCLSLGTTEQKQTYSWMGEADAIVSSRDGVSFSIKNCYYDKNKTKGDEKSIGLESDEIKKQEFIEKLNSGDPSKPFIADTENQNNGFPLLKWQKIKSNDDINQLKPIINTPVYSLCGREISSQKEFVVISLLGEFIGSGHKINLPYSGTFFIKWKDTACIKLLVK